MALPEAAAASVAGGQAQGVEPAPGGECEPIRAEDGLPMAAVAPRVPALERGLLLLVPLVARWDVGTPHPPVPRAAAAEGGAARTRDGGRPGQSDCQMHGGAGATRLRCGEESQRAQAAH